MKTFRDVLADPNSTEAQIAVARANVQENDSLLNILGGMNFENKVYLADKIRLTFAQMAVEFGLHSSGWDAEQYTNAGSDNVAYRENTLRIPANDNYVDNYEDNYKLTMYR